MVLIPVERGRERTGFVIGREGGEALPAILPGLTITRVVILLLLKSTVTRDSIEYVY